jgi:WD40 repeat protein
MKGFIYSFFAANAEHSDVIQSLSWKKDGTLLATSCKDKQIRILDPRLPANSFTHMANSHQSIKDSRVVWLGDTSRILTTGFDSVSVDFIINLFYLYDLDTYKLGWSLVTTSKYELNLVGVWEVRLERGGTELAG